MLNVRLNKDLEKKLKEYSELNHLSKTQVVKEALAMYFTKESLQSPYELGQDLFGHEEGSGRSQASTTYKDILKSKIREKYSH